MSLNILLWFKKYRCSEFKDLTIIEIPDFVCWGNFYMYKVYLRYKFNEDTRLFTTVYKKDL